MTMIAAVAFPDEIIVLSDSRVTYLQGKFILSSNDTLKKIYQLNQHTLLAYTTTDVNFTCKLIERMTIQLQLNERLFNTTSNFITEISKVATREYRLLAGSKPEMYFIYAGYDFKSKLKVESKKLKIVLNQCRRRKYFPELLKKIEVSDKKFTILSAPSPVLAKQSFPGGHLITTKGWNMGTAGSGENFVTEIEKYYPKMFYFPGSFNKGVMMQHLADSYIDSNNIRTIGGLVQLFIINQSGISPLQYVEHSGTKKSKKQYVDDEGNWIEENLITGSKTTVIQNLATK